MSKVLFTRQSIKEIDRISSTDRKRVLTKIKLLDYPFSKNLDIKLLHGAPGFYRLRSGQIRIIFEHDHKRNVLWIRKVGYRGSVYKM
ncbi:MAG: type II toxin-antitoxin system RelE/ParE family toxin [Patescibacteria group bacterium]|nr:type II toxin-antitoxin system RelE/ParE family toxin [Patescibacteria group bacterium]